MMEDRLSEKIRFQLFSESRDTFHSSNGLRELVALCGCSCGGITVKQVL